jgi:hypothetical protein
VEQRTRRRVRTGIVSLIALAVSMAAFVAAHAVLDRPNGAETVHLPSEVGGHAMSQLQRDYGLKYGYSDVPVVAAEYGGAPSYYLVLFDVPLRSHRLDEIFMGYRHHDEDIRWALSDLAGQCSEILFYGCMDNVTAALKAAVYVTAASARYGCVPVRGDPAYQGKVVCVWTDDRTFGVLEATPRGVEQIDVNNAVLVTQRAHKDSTSGPPGPCSFPSCPPSPHPRPTATVPTGLPSIPSVVPTATSTATP